MILKRLALAISAALIFILSSGCTFKYGDGLLAPPRLPETYSQLQKKLDEIIADGQTLQVSADAGSYRQPVQLRDLDCDGEDEAIAFFRTLENDIRIYLFRCDDDEYEQIGMAEVVGSLRAVRYPQYKSNGEQAVAVSWGQEGNYGMTVLALDGQGGISTLLDTHYSQMTVYDVNGDGVDELVFVRRVAASDPEEQRYTLSFYGIRDGAYREISTVELCREVRSVSNFSFARDSRGVTLYVDSQAVSAGNYVTDVIYFDGRQAVNRTIDPASGEGKLKRSLSVFSADINGDGVIDIPTSDRGDYIGEAPAAKDTRANLLYWVNLDEDGLPLQVAVTYHNVTDKWYIMWPEEWDGRVYAKAEKSTYLQYTKFYVPREVTDIDSVEEAEQSVLNIYVFTGEEREHSTIYSNVKLFRGTTGGNSYGYRVPVGAPEGYALGDERIEAMFRTIDSSW